MLYYKQIGETSKQFSDRIKNEMRVQKVCLCGKLDPMAMRESVEELASTYESPDDVINWYYGNKEQLSVIESQVVEDEIFDFILTEAKVTEKKMGYQDAIKPEDQTTESQEKGKKSN